MPNNWPASASASCIRLTHLDREWPRNTILIVSSSAQRLTDSNFCPLPHTRCPIHNFSSGPVLLLDSLAYSKYTTIMACNECREFIDQPMESHRTKLICCSNLLNTEHTNWIKGHNWLAQFRYLRRSSSSNARNNNISFAPVAQLFRIACTPSYVSITRTRTRKRRKTRERRKQPNVAWLVYKQSLALIL